MRVNACVPVLTAFLVVYLPSLAKAIPLYWNTFNVEGESQLSAQFVTYATLTDMLNDENRLDVFTPDGFFDGSFGANIVGSGSDGSTYWNTFNVEGESQVSAQFVTYAALTDMLNDVSRLDVFTPDGFFDGSFGANIVGSGAMVMLVTPVPEPASLAIFTLGLSVLGVAMSSRRLRRHLSFFYLAAQHCRRTNPSRAISGMPGSRLSPPAST